VLLPPLLFEDATDCRWHTMERVLPSSVLLALPGVAINAVMTGGLIKASFADDAGNFSVAAALLLGSMLAATDPVAVVGALKELHAPEKLSDLIKGESLLNDGSAVVFFT